MVMERNEEIDILKAERDEWEFRYDMACFESQKHTKQPTLEQFPHLSLKAKRYYDKLCPDTYTHLMRTKTKRIYTCTGKKLNGKPCGIKFQDKKLYEVCMNAHIVAAEEMKAVAANSASESGAEMTYNFATEVSYNRGDALSN